MKAVNLEPTLSRHEIVAFYFRVTLINCAGIVVFEFSFTLRNLISVILLPLKRPTNADTHPTAVSSNCELIRI